MDEAAVVKELMDRWQWSPTRYVMECVEDEFRPAQARIIGKIEKRIDDWREAGEQGHLWITVILNTCPGMGKDKLASWLVGWGLTCHPNARAITLAQRAQTVDALLWNEIRETHRKSVLGKLGHGRVYDGKPEMIFEGWPLWTGEGASAERHNPEALRGRHSPTFGMRVIDEASAVPDVFWTMTAGLSDAPVYVELIISNSWLPKGRFHELCENPPANAIYERITLQDMVDDGTFSQEYADAIAESLGGWEDPEFRALYMGEPLTESLLSRLNHAALALCVDRKPEGAGEKIVAVDVGRSTGGDPSAIVWAQGFDLIGAEKLQVRNTVRVAEAAIARASAFGAKTIVVDSVGVGGGVADTIREKAPNITVVEFIANEKAENDRRFANRATEAAWQLIDRINNAEVHLPDMPELHAEIGQIQFEPVTPKDGGRFGGRWQLVKAPNNKPSPNLFDALMMATAGQKVPASKVYAEKIKVLGRRCPECSKLIKSRDGWKEIEIGGRVIYTHQGACHAQAERRLAA